MILGNNQELLKAKEFEALTPEQRKEEVQKLMDKIEALQKEKKDKEMLEIMHSDELERLENMGEILIFEDLPTTDYLKIEREDSWKLHSTLIKYNPAGTPEYAQELEEERKRNSRKLTKEEARILGERLMKRKDHDHYCICEVCEANGASVHIKSFPVKPTKAKKRSRSTSTGRRSGSRARSKRSTGSKHSAHSAHSRNSGTDEQKKEATSPWK